MVLTVMIIGEGRCGTAAAILMSREREGVIVHRLGLEGVSQAARGIWRDKSTVSRGVARSGWVQHAGFRMRLAPPPSSACRTTSAEWHQRAAQGVLPEGHRPVRR